MFRVANGAWDLSLENPLTYIDCLPADPGRARFLSINESRIVLEEAKNTNNNKFHPFVLLLMHSGMRTGEAARIQTSAVDLENRLKPQGHKFRLSRQAAQIMLRPGCIFQDCWRRLWKRVHRKAADKKNYPDSQVVPRFTPHDIRHTAASHLLMQGVDIRIIADILGHSTLAMIMRYTHLYDNTKREHIDKISYLGNKEVL
jgi:integrase